MDYASYLNISSHYSDFGCGYCPFECFTLICNVLMLFLMFGLGFKILQFSCHCRGLVQFLSGIRGKSGYLTNGFCTSDVCELWDPKILACKEGLLGFLKNLSPSTVDNLERKKELVNICGNLKLIESSEEVSECQEDEEEEDELQCYPEDEEDDIIVLKEMIKIERECANAAHLELEKERVAAATAAEEVMSMILRLQSEKSSVEIQANQYRKFAEQKQIYDQEVIQSLHWIIFKLESQLKFCRQRLKFSMNSDEGDQLDLDGEDPNLDISSFNMDDRLEDFLISSLDIDSSFM